MAYYNPYYGNSYTQPNMIGQYYPQPAQPMMPAAQPQTQGQSDGIIWVQGEVGARAYPVQPGKIAVLMDSEDSYFYIKTVDIYGMPQPLRKFRFTEVTDEQKSLPANSQQMDTSNFITREELERRLDELTK